MREGEEGGRRRGGCRPSVARWSRNSPPWWGPPCVRCRGGVVTTGPSRFSLRPPWGNSAGWPGRGPPAPGTARDVVPHGCPACASMRHDPYPSPTLAAGRAADGRWPPAGGRCADRLAWCGRTWIPHPGEPVRRRTPSSSTSTVCGCMSATQRHRATRRWSCCTAPCRRCTPGTAGSRNCRRMSGWSRSTCPATASPDPDPRGRYSPSGMVEVVHAVVDALDLGQVVIGGNSMGGGVAWRYAILHPDVARPGPGRLHGIPGPGWRAPGCHERLPAPGGRPDRATRDAPVRRGAGPGDDLWRPVRLDDATIDRYWELLRREGNRAATVDRFRAGGGDDGLVDRIGEIDVPHPGAVGRPGHLDSPGCGGAARGCDPRRRPGGVRRPGARPDGGGPVAHGGRGP
jgi:pimeloyl-ACP methyl ester carboxylesterase